MHRYFRPGANWAGRTLYGVPVFGFALIRASGHAFGADDGFVVIGLVLWLSAAVLAEVLVWPGERRIQQEIGAAVGGARARRPLRPLVPSGGARRRGVGRGVRRRRRHHGGQALSVTEVGGTATYLGTVLAYLDHAATTPPRPEAVAAMLPYLTEHFGNPSGTHGVARRARTAVEDARDEVARCLGCLPGEVVFTAGGTEADNLAVLGARAAGGGTVVCSAVEHHAVRNACAALDGVTVPVLSSGVVDLAALSELLAAAGPDVALVSVMLVNNEVGTIQPLAEVAALVRRHAPRALLHTDAVAAVGWLDVAGQTSVADLVSVSAHKFGGPKGVGALVVRGGVQLSPVLFGGGQERDRRPGTHDVAGIVGMAAALCVATDEWHDEVARVGALRDRLADGLRASVPGVWETAVSPGPTGAPGRDGKVAASCHVVVAGVDQEELLVLLDEEGVCASAGAACASGAIEPSHVLRAMGVEPRRARSALRLSLGHTTTAEEVDHVLAVMPKVVERLRG